MSRLDKTCEETLCIRNTCPFKNAFNLCTIAFAHRDTHFIEIIEGLENEIKKIKEEYEKESQNKKPD